MNKKIIIVAGTIFLVFILFFGITVYKQEKDEKNLWLNTIPEDKCQNFLDDRGYIICCINNGKFYDCTDRNYFIPNQEMEILVRPDKIQNIPESFEYVCLITDMQRQLRPNGSFIDFPEECFSYKKEILWDIKGLTPSEIGNFTLLKANVYPDINRDVLVQKEEFTVLNLEKEIQK